MSAPSYAREREDFLVTMQAEGMHPDIARRILRHANTIQRLSVAECNGDWPCDNGERAVKPCTRCEAGYVVSSMFRDHSAPKVQGPGESRAWWIPLVCPNCRAQERITALCATARTTGEGGVVYCFTPVFQGDPRGACVKLTVPSGKTDDWGRTGVCVPTRRY